MFVPAAATVAVVSVFTLGFAACGTVAVAAAAAAAADIAFGSRFESLAVGGQPQGVAAGDLNGDGHTDLLVTHTGASVAMPDSAVRIFLGDGRGGWRVHSDVPVLAAPLGISVADWDRDGDLDAAVASAGRGAVQILWGAGDGSMKAGPKLQGGLRTALAVPLDFDADGKVDLAVLNLGTGKAPSSGLQGIAEGEESDSSSVVLYRLRGASSSKSKAKAGASPSFEKVATLQGGRQPVAIAVCDWTGDGRADVVLALRGSKQLGVHPGKAGGGFAPPQLVPVETAPTDLVAADVDGDGRAELVGTVSGAVETKAGWGLAVWRSGAGEAPQITRFENAIAYRIATADMDRDGKQDVVTLARDGVIVLRGNGDRTFQAPVEQRMDTGSSMVLARLDGDELLDLVAANPNGNSLSLLYANGAGGFGQGQDLATGAGPAAVLAIDVDRDGGLDLVTANSGDGTLSVFRRQGAAFARTDAATGDGPVLLASGDLDRDGDPDLVVGLIRGRASEVVVRRNRGDGTFDPRVQVASGVDPTGIFVADVNGDERADIVVARRSQPDVLVYFGNGDATFKPALKVPVGQTATSAAIGDLNGDGRLDLVLADAPRSSILPCLGKGDGTFASGSAIHSKLEPSALTLGDVTGDGKVDLIVGGKRQAMKAHILAGAGDGTFGQRIDVAVGPGAVQCVLADLDGDKKLDLVFPDSQLGAVTVIQPDDDGAFTRRRDFGTGIDPSGVAIADLDGDGKLDLAVSNRATNTLAVLPQR